MLGALPPVAFPHAEPLGHFRERAPRLRGRKSAHDGTMLTAILLKDELHHVVFAVVCEINVNVRKFVWGHPFLVQETPEVKTEANRTHVGNPQTIADE